MIDPARLIKGSIDVYGEEKFHALYGELLPVDEQRVIIAEDGFTLDLNGRELLFLDTQLGLYNRDCLRSLVIFTH